MEAAAPPAAEAQPPAAAPSPAAAESPTGEGAPAEEPVDFSPDFELFSTRRPRNLLAGTSSGLKSLVKGVFGGVSSLVVAPVLGAQSNGFPGFCQGLAQGVMGVVALPVAGACVATLQVA